MKAWPVAFIPLLSPSSTMVFSGEKRWMIGGDGDVDIIPGNGSGIWIRMPPWLPGGKIFQSARVAKINGTAGFVQTAPFF